MEKKYLLNNIQSLEILDIYNCFTIKWYMTGWCNYRCSYCFQNHTLIKPNNKELCDKAKQIADFIISYKTSNPNQKIRLSLSGGEVSVFPLETILLPIFEAGINVFSCITNGSGELNKLISQCKKFNIDFYCDFSFHEEYITPSNFINKVEFYKNTWPNYHYKILSIVTNKNTESQKELYLLASKKNIPTYFNFERSKVSEGEQVLLTNKEGLQLVKKSESLKSEFNCIIKLTNGNIMKFHSRRELLLKNKISPFGWKCDINSRFLFIYPDLSVKNSFCDEAVIPIKKFIPNNTSRICNKTFCPFCFPCRIEREV